MNLPTFARASVLLPTLLLAACQVTTFESSPVAAATCDPALVGRWESVDPDAAPGTPAEMRLEIDADCRLAVEERKSDGVRRGEPTPLHLGRHGDHAYAWIDARWVMRRYDEEDAVPEGDVVLMRWRLDGDTLSVWNTDDKPIAHAIIDGELAGSVRYADSDLFNRLTGDQDPSVLERAGFFAAEAGTFRRAGQD